MNKILATGPLNDYAVEVLSQCGEVVFAPSMDEDTLLTLIEDSVALAVRGVPPITARLIEAGNCLRVIGRSGSGYSNVDIKAATRRGIPVVYAPGAGARAVAEAAFTFMLPLCKRLPHWDRELRAGRWESRYESEADDLDGKTLGIVGLGRIGRILAEIARLFNLRVLAFDPFVSPESAQAVGATLVSLENLFSNSDFISLHAAETEETRGMVNRDLLSKVKRGAILINLARGGLIESLDVLHEALSDGRLSGVGLDVFDPYPPDTSHPLFQMENCLFSPHALGASKGALARIFASMAEDIVAVLEGRRPRFVVNPEVFSGSGLLG